MTKPKRHKRHSSEFKREAILCASEEGMTDKAVCVARMRFPNECGHEGPLHKCLGLDFLSAIS